MFERLKKPYQGVFKILGLYWKIYGGWRALVLSPYFHASILLTLLMSHFWVNEAWWDVSLSVLPNIIGFALGGYAIWLGFGDEQFRNLISERSDSDEYSPYLEVSATFAHFILIQLLALIIALVAKATAFHLSDVHWLYDSLVCIGFPIKFLHEIIKPTFYGIGFLIFVYALMTAVAATLAVFRVAYWFDTFRNKKNPDKKPTPDE